MSTLISIYKKAKVTARTLSMLLFASALLPSCSDFLEIEPLTEIVEDKFWNEESDVESIVMGCYASMESSSFIDRAMVWGEFRSDNIVGGTSIESNTSLQNIFKENINANNTYTTWVAYYDIINRCNTVMHYAPQVAEKDPNYAQSELLATQAEVSALRDLCYFYLIRTFRDVPYTTTAFLDDNQKMDLPATSFDNVLDSLIEDLESVKDNAVKKYSTEKTNYQQGRITQQAIYAMLCEMYLWKQDYNNCIRYANLIIKEKTDEYQKELDTKSGMSSNDKMIDGYPLINDASSSGNQYGSAFNSIFCTGCSRESIFELVYSDNTNMLSNESVSGMYGNSKTFPGIVKPSDLLGTDVLNETYNIFCNKFDTRYYENIQAVSSSLFGINKYASQGTTVTASGQTVKASWGELQSSSHSSANWIVYRLTDIMLLKAEALTQLVNEDDSTAAGKAYKDSLLTEAYNIVSVINKRSSCNGAAGIKAYSEYTNKTQMANLVLEERQRELMFEGKRWYDLVRRARRDGNTKYLVEKASQKGSDGGSVIQSKLAKMDAIYWPYNIDELKVNTNLVQNSAFGSGENSSYKKN